MIDLHMHSTASDGKDSPAALLEKVKSLGIRCFALTDHDTIDGVMEDEHVAVDIPAGVQYGEQIRVQRHGMPRLGSVARGSLIAVVQVVTPTDLTAEQMDALRRIAAERQPQEAEEDTAAGASESGAAAEEARAEGQAQKKAKPRPHKKNPFKNRNR